MGDWISKSQAAQSLRPHELPVTVIVPTYRRPESLSNCLAALSECADVPHEVIVVDDGSPQPVEPVVLNFRKKLNVRCLRQSNAGPATARNLGASLAKTDFIAFTDDDCEPERQWLSKLIEPLYTRPDALVGGRSENTLTKNIYSETSQDLLSFIYDWADQKEEGFDFFATNNLACSKEYFEKIGGFDRTFPLAAAEDRDLGLRWKARDWPLVYRKDAVVGHSHELTLKKYWLQQVNYGKGASHLRTRNAERHAASVDFEGLSFYLAMQNYPFRRVKQDAMKRSALLVLSQIALAAGFLSDRIEKFNVKKQL
jgi:GT2 family glycosyltransferase